MCVAKFEGRLDFQTKISVLKYLQIWYFCLNVHGGSSNCAYSLHKNSQHSLQKLYSYCGSLWISEIFWSYSEFLLLLLRGHQNHDYSAPVRFWSCGREGLKTLWFIVERLGLISALALFAAATLASRLAALASAAVSKCTSVNILNNGGRWLLDKDLIYRYCMQHNLYRSFFLRTFFFSFSDAALASSLVRLDCLVWD